MAEAREIVKDAFDMAIDDCSECMDRAHDDEEREIWQKKSERLGSVRVGDIDE